MEGGQISFSWAPKSLWMVTAAMKLKDICPLEDKILKSRDTTLPTKFHIVKARVFPVFLPGEYHGQRSLADIVRGVAKSQTQLSHYPSSLFHPHQEPLQLLFPFCLRVVSSAYLSLLMFLLTIFVPAGNQENEKDAPCQLLTRKWRSWNSHTLGVGCRHFGNLWHFWMTQ